VIRAAKRSYGAARQRAKRARATIEYFRRGYRYARAIAPPEEPLPRQRTDERGALEDIFDAHSEGPGIWKWRHSFGIYDRHLSRLRGRALQVVEIGVFNGGSLGMWSEYFGPEAHICGIDINPACLRFAREGIEVVIGDQADPSFWEAFLRDRPAPDVVIEDGGHAPEQQAVTLECLLPRMRAGGVYICEDIHGSFQAFHAFLDGLQRPLNDIEWPEARTPPSSLHMHVASVHRYPLIAVIEKPAWCPPTFEAPRRGSEWQNETLR
jgi:predicted O-methyltransferase YrrM